MATLAQSSQFASVNWGPITTKKRLSSVSDIIGQVGSNTYLLTFKSQSLFGNTPVIEIYDADMKMVKSVELLKQESDKNIQFEFIVLLQQQLCLFTSTHDSHSGNSLLYAQRIDNSTLQGIDKPLIVAQTPVKLRNRYDGFSYTLSPDKSKIGLLDLARYNDHSHSNFSLQVYDHTLNLLWQQELQRPYEDKFINFNKIKIDNSGNAYIQSKVFNSRIRTKRLGKPNYSYAIFAYTNKGTSKKYYPISLSDKFISDLTFDLAKNGDLICAGFYSDKDLFLVRGTYFLSIDLNTQATKTAGTKAFSKDFLVQFYNTKKAAKGKELYEYDLRKIKIRGDGGALLIAEQYYTLLMGVILLLV